MLPEKISLRYTIGKVTFLVAVAYICLVLLIQFLIVYPIFRELERQEAGEDVQRYLTGITREVEYLHGFNQDWSIWDDTYQFASDGNEAYRISNLDVESWFASRLCLIYIYNTEGTLVWGSYIDHENKTFLHSDPEVTKFFADHPDLVRRKDENDLVEGLVVMDRGPILLSVQPIVKSIGQGPVNGTMIIGLRIDEDFETKLGEQLGQPVEIRPITYPRFDNTETKARDTLLSGQATTVLSLGHQKRDLWCFAIYPDLYGKPGALVRATVARDIMPAGEIATRVGVFSTLGAGLLILGLSIWLLQLSVIRPLGVLTRSVTSFDTFEPPDLAGLPTRTDEIGQLAREFDRIAHRVEEDMKRREIAERALRDSEAHIRTVLNSTPDGIITVTDNGQIESVNRSAELIFGYAEGELISEPIILLFPDHLPADTNHRTGTGEHIVDESWECDGTRSDGTKVPLYITRGHAGTGKQQATLYIARDISELRRIHEQLRRKENLAMLGEMGASLAHEIKNPLAGISSAIQVLRDGLDAADSRREIISEILLQVARLDQSVRDLLMFARPWKPEMKECDVRTLIENVIEFCRGRDEFRGVTFAIDSPSTVSVTCDTVLIQHVLNNVFVNAAQAMPDGGTIRVTIETGANRVRMRVHDTGVGVAEHELSRVFQPFFTTKARGSGLGLTVSRTITEAHGGSIELKSSTESGTEVVVELPARAGADVSH
jgi:PAS domain S-box-containing protein